jgi:hypothetical protein
MLSQGGPYYTQMCFNWTCVGVLMKVICSHKAIVSNTSQGCSLSSTSFIIHKILRPHKPLPNKSICWLAPSKQSTTNCPIMHHVGNMIHVTFSSNPIPPFRHLSCHTSYWQVPNNEHYCLQKKNQIFNIWNSAKWHNKNVKWLTCIVYNFFYIINCEFMCAFLCGYNNTY